MRTYAELINAAEREGVYQPKSFTQATGIKDLKLVRFQDVINALEADEDILFCFPYNIDCCVAFTNKRVIEAGRMTGFFMTRQCTMYPYESISGVEGFVNYITVKIMGEKDKSYMPLRGREGVAVAVRRINEAISAYRSAKSQPAQMVINQSASPADELKKFKELLDMGIISQAEFDAKKQQLLGF